MFNYLNPRRRFLAVCVAICLCSLALIAAAPPPAPTPAKAAPPKAGDVSEARDLEAFFDGVVPVQLESKHIAGAVVVVVVGDRVVFSKGYGYADVEKRRKVDPNKTLFRIASISKLFTWTAVMQQVEEGKLDLNADVNKYLKDVQIPEAFGKPVTLKDILTHSPGFDDYVIGLFGRKPEDVRPLAEVLKEQMPTRVRKPGELASYSNHGTAIAGYAVACVSGMPWEEYVEKRILKPLGMNNTMTRQPAEQDLPAGMSRGYKWAAGRFKAEPFEYVPAAPAGCISTTAADAAKFMLAHLHDGRLGDARILKPETARQMRQPLFYNDPHERKEPKTSAMCYGFWEQKRNGQRIVGHGGDTLWFHSLMELIPKKQVGLFVSYNTDTSGGERGVLFDAFLRRYFPQPDPARVKPSDESRERAKRCAGEYGSTRYSHTTAAKLVALMAPMKVSANDDGTLTIRSGLGGNAGCFVEVEPYVFRAVDGSARVVFEEDDKGHVAYLFPDNAAAVTAVRHKWYERSDVNWGLLGGSLAIFLSAVLFWPAIAFSVRGLQSPQAASPAAAFPGKDRPPSGIKRTGFSALLSILAWLLGVVAIVFVAALVYTLQDNSIVFGLTRFHKGLLALTQVVAVLAGLTVLGCLVAWRRRYWRLSGRLHYTLVALAGVGFVWFLYYWNLLTFGFHGLVA
jgi:CubicO group peptidase (beta-lactamase class C family)